MHQGIKTLRTIVKITNIILHLILLLLLLSIMVDLNVLLKRHTHQLCHHHHHADNTY